jgi:hypothetical protein
MALDRKFATGRLHAADDLPIFCVMGCISYRFAFGEREIHQTGFILDIIRVDPTRAFSRMMIPKFKGEFPIEELRLGYSIMGAGVTD